MKCDLDAKEKEHARMRKGLVAVGWISQGYVQDRGPGAGGPCCQWTRKVRGRTVAVAMSKEQYGALRGAITGWREVQKIPDRMQQLIRQRILGTLPDTRRRRRLTRKVLGLNQASFHPDSAPCQ